MHKSFAEDLGETSDGGLEITVHGGGSLGIPPAEILEYVRTGRADIGENTPSYTSGTWYDSLIDSQQMLYPTHEAAVDAWKLLRDEFDRVLQEEYNAKLLYGGPSDAQMIFTNKPVKTLDDLQGLVLRASSETQSKLINAIPGASATVLPAAEVYTALQRNTIEGVITSSTNAEASSFDEVAHYALDLPVNFAFVFTFVNLDSYEALSEENRAALDEAAERAEGEWAEAGNRVSQEAKDRLEAEGTVEFFPASAEIVEELGDIARPQWQEWADGGGENAQAWLDLLLENGFPENYSYEAQ